MCEKCSKEENERVIREYVSAVNGALDRIAKSRGGFTEVLSLAVYSAVLCKRMGIAAELKEDFTVTYKRGRATLRYIMRDNAYQEIGEN